MPDSAHAVGAWCHLVHNSENYLIRDRLRFTLVRQVAPPVRRYSLGDVGGHHVGLPLGVPSSPHTSGLCRPVRAPIANAGALLLRALAAL